MPNLRARPQPSALAATPFVLVARPPFAVVGIARGAGGAPLAQATVKLFSASADQLVAREFSDALGRYAAPVSDALTYWVMARQSVTADRTFTIDTTAVTADRVSSVQGATVDTLVGAG